MSIKQPPLYENASTAQYDCFETYFRWCASINCSLDDGWLPFTATSRSLRKANLVCNVLETGTPAAGNNWIDIRSYSFTIVCDPRDSERVVGVPALWAIALTAAREDVAHRALAFLAAIHLRLGKDVYALPVWQEFISTCMKKIRCGIVEMESESREDAWTISETSLSSRTVARTTALLDNFLNEIEPFCAIPDVPPEQRILYGGGSLKPFPGAFDESR